MTKHPAGEGDRMGWPPGHFYSPIPSLNYVRARRTEIFNRDVRPLPGIDLNDAGQLATFDHLVSFYGDQPFPKEKQPGLRFYYENPNFTLGEGIVLQAMMRWIQPGRIVEVGGGFSSCAILDTNDLFLADQAKCTFIEPYPELLKSLLAPGDREKAIFIEAPVQDVGLDEFSSLEAGDILLIDSSHVSKVGSDVNHLLFSVLPTLRTGVYVHFHDIAYPFEYPESWVLEGRAWNEAYLVRAFLQFNSAFEIVFFNSYFALRHPQLLEDTTPLIYLNPGTSLWLRRI